MELSDLFSSMHIGRCIAGKKAMELIAKGWSALKEEDRIIDYCELNDKRLIPLLRAAKENFELALEADNSNTHARGAALLVEAAYMGDKDAQYELGCRLRVENDYVQSDQQAFYYLEKAVDQLHPGALYLLGAVYLTGDCVKKDIASAFGVSTGHQRRDMLERHSIWISAT